MKTLEVKIGFRWWVKPYLALLFFVVWSVAFFADEETMSEFIDNQVAWIVEHGLRFQVS